MLQGPILVADLVNGLCLKDCSCTINLLYTLDKISMFITLMYQEPVVAMNLSASRSNLERHPYSKGHPAMWRAAILEGVMGPGLPTIYGIK